MARLWAVVGAAMLVAACGGGGAEPTGVQTSPPQGVITTQQYIATFDQAALEFAGADYHNERYSWQRLDKPLADINRAYDYDFDYLDEVIKLYAQVDRRMALKAIFDEVTAGAATNLEKHLAVLKFLHKAGNHNFYMQPIHRDGQLVTDPIVLLALGEMRCGAVARVAVDLFEVAGYPGRLAHGLAHTTAEIYYDGGWHLFEGDLAGGGMAPMVGGRIPSLRELAASPYLMDQIPSHFEVYVSPAYSGRLSSLSSPMYPSWFYFSSQVPGSENYHYKKATQDEIALDGKHYGWNYFTSMTAPWVRPLLTPKYEPNPPLFSRVVDAGAHFTISWDAAGDQDNDLLGYRVYVSSTPRGWNHHAITVPESVEPYFQSGWHPSMYDALYREPPRDVDFIETAATSVDIPVAAGQTRYVTVMAYDAHGESVGRRLYNMSIELRLTR